MWFVDIFLDIWMYKICFSHFLIDKLTLSLWIHEEDGYTSSQTTQQVEQAHSWREDIPKLSWERQRNRICWKETSCIRWSLKHTFSLTSQMWRGIRRKDLCIPEMRDENGSIIDMWLIWLLARLYKEELNFVLDFLYLTFADREQPNN